MIKVAMLLKKIQMNTKSFYRETLKKFIKQNDSTKKTLNFLRLYNSQFFENKLTAGIYEATTS